MNEEFSMDEFSQGHPEVLFSDLVFDDDFSPSKPNAISETTAPGTAEIEMDTPRIPIRERFPEAGTTYLGGTSDGWEYQTIFAGSKLAHTYEMVKQFLIEEGYGGIPVPDSVDDLRLFKRSKQLQLQLFAEKGYVHNPIKILFPLDSNIKNTLILKIYNENAPKHLLRFHKLV